MASGTSQRRACDQGIRRDLEKGHMLEGKQIDPESLARDLAAERMIDEVFCLGRDLTCRRAAMGKPLLTELILKVV